MHTLFVNHQLNYFEALDRMAHWIKQIKDHNDPGEHCLGRIGILQRVLAREAETNTLWFDPSRTVKNHGPVDDGPEVEIIQRELPYLVMGIDW